MEKLELMIMLASERTIDQILNEFKEAAQEVDVEFVRKAVRAIGRCAIKIDKAAERCIQVLLELIQTKVNYVVQEAIIVIKDIFRKYPNKYESIIAKLCENLDTLDEPEAKASMIWIIGEYAERIDNANQLLDSFLESFHDENTQVQLQLLTGIVKLFLKRPKDTQEMVQKVLNLATQETDNPDLRDRGYVYWRLLSTDPEAAKAVVLGERPLISDNTTKLEEQLLDELIGSLSTLASVYHKPAETFVSKLKEVKKEKKYDEGLLSSEEREDRGESPQMTRPPNTNILDLDGGAPSGGSQPSGPKNLLDELDFFGTPSSKPAAAAKEIVLPADRANGMQIAATFIRRDGQVYMDITVSNQTPGPMSDIALQFNKSSFGFAPGSQPNIQVIMPGQSADSQIPISLVSNMLSTGSPVSGILQVAVKNNQGVYYFQINVPIHVLFVESGQLARDDYLNMWKTIQEEHFKDISGLPTSDPEVLQKKLQASNVFYIAKRNVQSQDFLYFSVKLMNDMIVLLELAVTGPQTVKSCIRTKQPELVTMFESSLITLLSR